MSAPPRSLRTDVRSPARILIIDDEPRIRESLETLLTLEGFDVTLAPDGPAASTALSARSSTCSCSTSPCPARAASTCCRASSACTPSCPSS